VWVPCEGGRCLINFKQDVPTNAYKSHDFINVV